MSSLKPHPSLPAPVVHAGLSLQAKSSVLTGVQDAYWSDEEEAKECPLCLEEMDISDLNFKPCQCEYQICRFCWNHIRSNLNNKCPACRRDYSDEVGQMKPINKEDQRRLVQQKKQRERERKDLDTLGRRHLANVRVVQRNVVYVVGIGPRFAKEELISTLRSNDYFGQYGRISKIIIVKRTRPGTQVPVVGLYITYHRKEDAARCIAAVDGSASPGGGNEIMRASYGTTKYCMSFLRGVNCPDHNCMNLHEWGDEKDCFTKEDLTTLQHTIKDTEVTRKSIVLGKKADDSSARLPRSALWAKSSHDRPLATTPLNNHTNTAPATAVSIVARSNRRGEKGARLRPVTPVTPEIPEAQPTSWKVRDAKASSAKASSVGSASRPSTPANSKAMKQKPASPPVPVPPRSPTSSVTFESDAGSGSQDATSLSPAPTPAIPQDCLRSPRVFPHQVAAAHLARRESALPSMGTSPFPDFDRTLQNLAEVDGKFGGFSFNLDPKLAEAELEDDASELPEATLPFHGSFIDAFPALRTHSPVPSQASPALSYTGSFNPFAESNESDPSAALRRSGLGDDSSRKMSRFGFARSARQNGNHSSASSPLVSSTPLSPTESTNHGQHLFGPSPTELGSPSSQWSSYQYHTHPLHSRNVSAASSPLVPQAQAQVHGQIYQHLPSSGRFQPFDQSTGISEAALREFIQNSREQQQRTNAARNAALVDQEQSHSQQQQQYHFSQQQLPQFNDPAIMSASFGLQQVPPQEAFVPQAYGPPPGLAYPPGLQSDVANDVLPARSPSPLLSSSDFPALTAQPPQPPSASSDLPVETRANGDGAQEDDEKARRAEKERERAEKKAEKERLERERKELEKLEKEQEREREEAARAEAQKKANPSGKSQKAEVPGSSAPTRRSNARSVPVPKSISTPTSVPASTLSIPPPSQGPLLSKMPKKNRPVTKPIRIPKEDESMPETPSVLISAATSEAPQFSPEKGSTSVLDSNSTSSRGQSVERTYERPNARRGTIGGDRASIPNDGPCSPSLSSTFRSSIQASKMTLEYGPLAHALSALSVGGGSFANNMPSGSVRTDRTAGAGKDEVAALTLALERRARWMEVQLSKLEELHRDINTAAVRAVLAFNDSGWDPHGFAPRTGGTLQRFDALGTVQAETGGLRQMTAEELEEKLAVAKEAAVFAETEVREIMGRVQATLLPNGGVPESLICLM
ncbi:hypothetical protein EDB89DRAFT_2224101 [Lactarius sanguifluus]|nr:hypothetical protein EDB89DRAFT_2224101 [Lactarius sanguifluus]